MAAACSGSACLVEQSAVCDARSLRTGANIRWKGVRVARVPSIVCHGLCVSVSIEGRSRGRKGGRYRHQVFIICHAWLSARPRDLKSAFVPSYYQPHDRPHLLNAHDSIIYRCTLVRITTVLPMPIQISHLHNFFNSLICVLSLSPNSIM